MMLARSAQQLSLVRSCATAGDDGCLLHVKGEGLQDLVLLP